jgi:hypothetical protein
MARRALIRDAMRRLSPFLALGLAFAAGSGSSDAWANTSQPAEPAPSADKKDYPAELRKLPAAAANATMFRAISDSGESCTGVTKSAYQQDYKGMAMWVAHCRSGTNWAVFVSHNGYIQARACATAAEAGFPACKPL